MDPYKVLQVDPEAEDEVIQAAYRRLAQKYHPDVAGSDGAARMASINAAWEQLRDPHRRAAHDRERRATAAHSDPTSSRSPAAARGSGAPSASGGSSAAGRPPDTVSSDWTSGRSATGSGYDPSRMRSADGFGAAGQPPGNPSGAVLPFGRYAGWSLGEVARGDIDYVEWLDR